MYTSHGDRKLKTGATHMGEVINSFEIFSMVLNKILQFPIFVI